MCLVWLATPTPTPFFFFPRLTLSLLRYRRLLCPSRTIATLASNLNGTRAYVYTFAVGPRFNDFLSLNQTGFDLVPPRLTGSDAGWGAHGTDVGFTFNDTGGVLLGDENISYPNPFSAAEQVLANDMMGFWGSIATVGIPLGRSEWPEYVSAGSTGESVAEEVVMRLDLGDKLKSMQGYKADDCYFWQTH